MPTVPPTTENLGQTRDAAANDSDKTFTVPAGKTWRVRSVQVQLVSTATVGARVMVVEIGDGANVYLTCPAAATQAASLTRNYSFAPGLVAAAQGNYIASGFPDELTLPAGHTIRVYDAAAVDAAADDMTVTIERDEY